jgi:penicillin amidase
MDKAAPLVFAAWMDRFYRLVLQHANVKHGLGAPISDFVAMVLGANGASNGAGAQWCGGDCTPLLRDALNEVSADLEKRVGSDVSRWRWGDVHEAIFAHPLLRFVPVLGPLSTIHIPAPGDNDTLDRGATNATLQDVHGATFRGVYDLADLNRSVFVMAPGQSGNLFSAHARDFVTRWRDGATIRLGPDPAQVSQTVHLTP